jgi:hypothetical protein
MTGCRFAFHVELFKSIFSLMLLFAASAANAASVDWKLYGAASVSTQSFCFYDEKSVIRASNSYVRVWTKCLAQKAPLPSGGTYSHSLGFSRELVLPFSWM